MITAYLSGAATRMNFYRIFSCLLAAGISAFANSGPAGAADQGITPRPGAVLGSCAEVVLACEDGRQYPLCPIAVSLSGDIVTASLHTDYGSTHVRLVPMGVGYRYAGRGVWLDGLRENAVLNFGNSVSIACTVTLP
jgi:hypothetical protein